MDVRMLSHFQNCDFVPDSKRALHGDWHHLHTQASNIGACSLIHGSETPQCLVRFAWVSLACDLVYIWHLAACSSCGYIIFVKSNLDPSPGIFMVGFWACHNQICTEPGSRKTRGAFDLWHFGLDVADTGEVDEVERVLERLA